MSQFTASADRGWIAYHLWSCEECRPAEPPSGLWVAGAGTQARLVLPGGGDAPWSWAPSGAQLAYADDDVLILLDPTTWEHTPIATAAGRIRMLAWGPDGRSIVYSVEPPFTGASDPSSFGVIVLRSGGEPVQVSDAAEVRSMAWSPDGSSLLLDRVRGDRSLIELITANGSAGRVLVEGPMREGPGAPVWSPDGRRIAFIRTPSVGERTSTEIWVIGADGQDEARLGATSGSWGGGPVWSPDSQRVAWSSVSPGYWVAVDADDGGFPQQIDQLEAERWRQG